MRDCQKIVKIAVYLHPPPSKKIDSRGKFGSRFFSNPPGITKKKEIRKMGKMKEWLMDMEEDATKLSANQFKIQHGEEHIYIWEEVNGPEFPEITGDQEEREVL